MTSFGKDKIPGYVWTKKSIFIHRLLCRNHWICGNFSSENPAFLFPNFVQLPTNIWYILCILVRIAVSVTSLCPSVGWLVGCRLVGRLIGWLVGWSVGWPVCHNCQRGREVTLPWSYRHLFILKPGVEVIDRNNFWWTVKSNLNDHLSATRSTC